MLYFCVISKFAVLCIHRLQQFTLRLRHSQQWSRYGPLMLANGMQHTLHIGADTLLIVVDFGHQALLHALEFAILTLQRTFPVRAILYWISCSHFRSTDSLISPHQSRP